MTRAKAQLSLFGPDEAPPLDTSADAALMSRVPSHVRFGTSSWSFPGWAGIVYRGQPSERELAERGLVEYAAHPLFRTVGIDRSYYRPLDAETLRQYSEQLPPGFPCVIKAWNRVTSAVDHQSRAPNPDYLNADIVERQLLEPLQAEFSEHLGVLVFELAPLASDEVPHPIQFARKLDRFFSRLPKGPRYAVELRNRRLFSPAYLEVLARHAVAHTLNFWERMPEIGQQLSMPGVLTADFVVARLLIPPGERYQERKQSLAPFNQLVQPQEKMRIDVEYLIAECERLDKALFVIVNNKAEGSSPLTIRAIAQRVAAGRR